MGAVSVTHFDSRLSLEWQGLNAELYLSRCQVDTPDDLVRSTWEKVAARRARVGTVVDFGAGDGRFAWHGSYARYNGFEIDSRRAEGARLPPNACLTHACAFSSRVAGADLCIGNPPFVRNQDLPAGWSAKVASELRERSGVALSGLANAWQYFFLLSLLSTADDGLCALVIPFEWVSRPSAAAIRQYIAERGWSVDVYRLPDEIFDSVLTTASVTVVDKRDRTCRWRFFDERGDGEIVELPSTTGSVAGHVAYSSRTTRRGLPRAMRGLSPGTQKVFTLTEAERARLGLAIGRDVVPCVTSMKTVIAEAAELDRAAFEASFRFAGQKCWLIRPDENPSRTLQAYLDSVPPSAFATSTCLERDVWWRFRMPRVPSALVATCFKGRVPKAVLNTVGAVSVGGVAGILDADADWVRAFLPYLASLDLDERIVAHANGLRKVEINQLNTLLAEFDTMATKDA